MEVDKETASVADEAEDLPSDFFDDFNKADFMEGLSVIDSWNDEDKTGKVKGESRGSRARINAIALDSVKDLRELIGDPSEYWNEDSRKDIDNKSVRSDSRSRLSSSHLDEFIKPGSRRDPNKTNEAIKRDKEVKVKELLAKQLESSDNLRPPGTELDDFYEDKPREPKKVVVVEEVKKSYNRSPTLKHRGSPGRRKSPRRSPIPRRRSPRRSPHRRSPVHRQQRYSPPRRSPHRRSPQRRSPQRRSPFRVQRKYSPYRNYNKYSPPRRSPRRSSPVKRSPRWEPQQRSPHRRSYEKKSHSRSPFNDSFLYPPNSNPMRTPYGPRPTFHSMAPNFGTPMAAEFAGPIPGFSYSQPAAYSASFVPPYDYGAQAVMPPQPVPVPAAVQVPIASMDSMAPAMVPPPGEEPPYNPATSSHPAKETKTPYDALAQLVADGKLSKEDYIKLAPNKGVNSAMDTKSRVMVLTRCSAALSKLGSLRLPNRLLINNTLVGPDPKSLAPKFCSPLKRQAVVEFHFSKVKDSHSTANKQIVDSIISTLRLDDVVSRIKRKPPKDMKDVAVQTTKMCCDVCEIRESTKCHDASTEVDPEQFTSTVHTQVVEQDLANSKSIFNPSGSVADGAPISIAHMTPAQLVSQLAARAKTLKQTDPELPPGGTSNQYRRNQNFDYGGQYQNYNNYRY